MSGALPGSDKDSMEVGEQDTDHVAESVELEVVPVQQPVSSLFAPALEVIHKLIDELNSELEVLRKDAREKEAPAAKAKGDIDRVERQLKSLLSDYGCQAPPPAPAPTPSSSDSSSQAQPLQPLQPQSKGPVYVERGKCKFACGSTTHQYATECDVYPALSDRRDRMHELHLCFRCFQQHLSPGAEADCKPVPCFYCSQNNREMRGHVSALCPFMFPH